MSKVNRREFLKSSAGLVALATLDLGHFGCSSVKEPAPAVRTPRGANAKLNVAVIGLGGRSGSHVGNFGSKANCVITHVCDPDTARAAASIEKARASNGGVDPVYVQDLRRVFDDKSIDIVSIATCNHWHSLAAIWAMQAGKDVYVEKPLSQCFTEGRRVVQVSARTGRVCQHGSQMRSNPSIIESLAFVQSGALGKIKISRALCYKPRPSIGKSSEPHQPPSTVDYDLWCGPAAMAPVMREKFHYDWHWTWDFGNGDIGNQGIHEIDLARWALGTSDMPISVQSVGGRFGYIDDGQTANTQIASYDFGEGKPKLIVEVRGLPSDPYRTKGVENVVECENGWLVSPSYTSAIAYDRDGGIVKKFEGGGDGSHFKNFLSVVRGAPISDLNCPPIEAHRSCALLHMANISYRTGKPVPFEPRRTDVFGNDAEGNETMERITKHLSDNHVPLASTNLTVGRRLTYNAAKETFKDEPEANRMMTREDRKPFVVPATA